MDVSLPVMLGLPSRTKPGLEQRPWDDPDNLAVFNIFCL
jgi:hypothetical protein